MRGGVSHDEMEANAESHSVVKYICVEEVIDDIDLFQTAVKERRTVAHSDYEDLHEKVFLNCPRGYQCVEPIALFHEVFWSMGLRKGENGRHVRVCLRHALDSWEYGVVCQTPSHSVCVDIVALTSSDPRSAARPVVQ
jgi:hypothetical protein